VLTPPFFTKTFSRTLPEPTSNAAVILGETLALAAKRQAGRPIRLLGLGAEMTMPERDAAEGTP
jgi:DNA polymerase-4